MVKKKIILSLVNNITCMWICFFLLFRLFICILPYQLHIVNRFEEDLEKKENDVMKMKQRLLEVEFDNSG